MTTTTAEASLAHWSEEGRQGMDAFYHLAANDYLHLALARDWVRFFQEHEELAAGRPVRLLDVACGSGKFPAALLRHKKLGAAGLNPIQYALLDPASFSIGEARSVLAPPFVPAEEYELPLEALEVAENAYDVVWATHALYAIPASDLGAALERFLHAMGGTGFIAHAAKASHYIHFDEMFRDAFGKANRVPYSTGEDVVAALQSLGANPTTQTITYETSAPLADRDQVEGFLQRCVFDNSVSLDGMLEHPVVGAYLRECQNDGRWRFIQRVVLISLTAR